MKKVISIILAAMMLFGLALPGAINLATKASAKTIEEYSTGDTIEFGSYPQSKVTDSATISALDAKSKTWISYGYYSGTGTYDDGKMTPSDYMKYCDITYNGNKYRAVTFSSYRPFTTGYESSASDSKQDDNGYYTGNVYYFKYEPLTWRVLDPSDGFVMCEKAIDSQAYNSYLIYVRGSSFEVYGDSLMTYYVCDWVNSSIRAWLNADFYNTAFTSSEKSKIGITYNENKSPIASRYDSANTSDKIFLLSYSEVLNTKYGFSSSDSAFDTARRLSSTDYAQCQGCTIYGFYYYEANWCLRSPGYSYYVAGVGYNGYVSSDSYFVSRTDFGIVPAFKFNPKSAMCDHNYDSVVTKEATCTENGVKTYTCSCGDSYTEVIPAKGHTWSEWEVIALPTVEAEGGAVRECSVCHEKETRFIEKLKVLVNVETGVEIVYTNEFSDDSKLEVSETPDDTVFRLIGKDYGDNVNTVVYDINVTKDGGKVQPTGTVTVRIPVPADFNGTKIIVVYVDTENGTTESIPCTIVDGYVEFKTAHFSKYALVWGNGNVKSVSISDIEVKYKDSARINPEIKADEGIKYTVTYTSSNPSVAAVDKDGNITAAAKGTATITCTVTDEFGNTAKDTCTVNVKLSFGQWILWILLLGFLWY